MKDLERRALVGLVGELEEALETEIHKLRGFALTSVDGPPPPPRDDDDPPTRDDPRDPPPPDLDGDRGDPPPDRDPPDDDLGDDDRRDPPPPDPPSRDVTRGSRRRVPRELTDKTGYGSGWGNSGDAVYLTPTHALIFDEVDGVHEMAELTRVRLRPGYRSGLHSSMGDTDTRYKLWLTDSAIHPSSPNGPDQNWKGQGTLWAGRMYGIHSGLISNVQIRDWFGDSYADNEATSREGHGFYFTLSQTPGALLRYEDLTFDTLGGHALHFATAFGDRVGNAPPPQMGGVVEIDHCDFANTDRCQARGSYAISMKDIHASVIVSNSNIVQDHPVYKNGQPSQYKSRGGIVAEGVQQSLVLRNNYWGFAAPSDRHAQVWIQGPETVEMIGNTFDCPVVSVNHPYGDNAGTVHTKKLVFRNNKGNARVEWKGQFIGLAHELNGEWTL